MGFKGVLDPATNPLIDDRGRYISQLLEENELDPASTGKETNISEWQEAKGRSSVKLQHPPSTEHITNTENGYKALHYITQLMEGGGSGMQRQPNNNRSGCNLLQDFTH